MSRREQPIELVDLDHAPADQHRTLIRVLARLAAQLGQPAAAELVVSHAEAAWLSFPARAWSQDPAGLWRGVFAVPAAVIERPQFGFTLTTAGHTLVLPHPGFATGDALASALLPVAAAPAGPASGPAFHELTAEHVAQLTGGRLRTRAVALATALAVTAGSTPALALAGSGWGPVTSPIGHAQATRERIEQLAAFAVERARADAARKRARAGTSSRSTASGRRATSAAPASGGLSGRVVAEPGSSASAARAGGSGPHHPQHGAHAPAQQTSRDPAPTMPNCAHPMAVIATAAAHASKRPRAGQTKKGQEIRCGSLGPTVTGTPAGTAQSAPGTATGTAGAGTGGPALGSGTTPTIPIPTPAPRPPAPRPPGPQPQPRPPARRPRSRPRPAPSARPPPRSSPARGASGRLAPSFPSPCPSGRAAATRSRRSPATRIIVLTASAHRPPAAPRSR